MARKIKAKLMLSLRASGCSRNEIAQTYGMAKRSVIDVFDAADELGMEVDEVGFLSACRDLLDHALAKGGRERAVMRLVLR